MNTGAQHEIRIGSLLHGAMAMPASGIGWVRVTGEDRVRWLNGMVTNSVQALESGQGAYTFLLNAQGRIQGDAVVWAEADALYLETAKEQVPAMMELLDRFIIMDDVELAAEERAGILLAGSSAEKVLRAAGFDIPAGEGYIRKDGIQRMDSPLVPRFEIWDAEALAALEAQGAVSVTEAEFEQLRVLEGLPLFGADIREKELPQETGQDRALHFNKGCYLGQEIVERIRSRGNVHRTFHAFRIEGEAPAPGTALSSAGQPVGELTTVSPELGIALGYVRREALERGAELTYPGGVAVPIASPIQIESIAI